MSSYVDSHCHLDLYESPNNIVSTLAKNQTYAVTMTNSPTVFEHSLSLSKQSRFLRAAVGLHPELAAERVHEIELFPAALLQTRFVGEIGLDYTTTDMRNRKLQREALERILELCSAYDDRVISLHSRRAAGDVISAVGRDFPGTVIMHWFSGSFSELKRAVEYGFLFSVNLAMIRSKKGRSLVSRIPEDRILTESDGPFVQNGASPSSPLDMPAVTNALGDVWQCTQKVACARVFRNFKHCTSRNS